MQVVGYQENKTASNALAPDRFALRSALCNVSACFEELPIQREKNALCAQALVECGYTRRNNKKGNVASIPSATTPWFRQQLLRRLSFLTLGMVLSACTSGRCGRGRQTHRLPPLTPPAAGSLTLPMVDLCCGQQGQGGSYLHEGVKAVGVEAIATEVNGRDVRVARHHLGEDLDPARGTRAGLASARAHTLVLKSSSVAASLFGTRGMHPDHSQRPAALRCAPRRCTPRSLQLPAAGVDGRHAGVLVLDLHEVLRVGHQLVRGDPPLAVERLLVVRVHVLIGSGRHGESDPTLRF